LPQLLGPIKNLGGVDWKWQREKYPGYAGKEFSWPEKTLRAAVTAAESQVPGVSQAGKLTGLTSKYVDHKTNAPSTTEALKKLVNPLQPVKQAAPKKKKAKAPKVKRKMQLGGSGGKLPLGASGGKLPLG
jgi:hypothetical protein